MLKEVSVVAVSGCCCGYMILLLLSHVVPVFTYDFVFGVVTWYHILLLSLILAVDINCVVVVTFVNVVTGCCCCHRLLLLSQVVVVVGLISSAQGGKSHLRLNISLPPFFSNKTFIFNSFASVEVHL